MRGLRRARYAARDGGAAPESGGNAQAYPAQARTSRVRWLLDIRAGVHRGARIPVQDGEPLLVGSGRDCDIVLSDTEVAPHHCLVACSGGRLSVRAVDAELGIGAHRLRPGQRWRAVVSGDALRIGGAEFRVRRAGGTGEARSETPLPAWMLRPGRRLGLGDRAALGVTLGGGVVAVTAAAILIASPLGSERADANAALGATPGGPSATAPGNAAPVSVSATATAEPARTGEHIAEDVAEVLRLSGIESEASFLGNGRVKVRGHLGPEDALKEIIHSRAMRDIQGLNRVVAVNFDAEPRQTPPAESAQRVIAVVDGKDPYLVTQGGSRYYTGARLPGGWLVDIEGDQVIVDDGQQIQVKTGKGLLLGKPDAEESSEPMQQP